MSSGASGTKDSIYAVAVLDDMFFASKLREAARTSGVRVEFIKSGDALHGFNPPSPPSLVIVDLANKNIDPLELIKAIKSGGLRDAHVIGYMPHVAKELAARALEAGYDDVLPRSRLSRELVEILSGITHPDK